MSSRMLDPVILLAPSSRKRWIGVFGLAIACLFLVYFALFPEEIRFLFLGIGAAVFAITTYAMTRAHLVGAYFEPRALRLQTVISSKRIPYSDIVAWDRVDDRRLLLRKFGASLPGYHSGTFTMETEVGGETKEYGAVFVLGTRVREAAFILRTSNENRLFCFSPAPAAMEAFETLLRASTGAGRGDVDGRIAKPLTPAQDRRAFLLALGIPLISVVALWGFFAYLYFALGPDTIIPIHWNIASEVDAYGTPASLLMVPILLSGIIGFFILIGISTRRLFYMGERAWAFFLFLFPAILAGVFIGLLSVLYIPAL